MDELVQFLVGMLKWFGVDDPEVKYEVNGDSITFTGSPVPSRVSAEIKRIDRHRIDWKRGVVSLKIDLISVEMYLDWLRDPFPVKAPGILNETVLPKDSKRRLHLYFGCTDRKLFEETQLLHPDDIENFPLLGPFVNEGRLTNSEHNIYSRLWRTHVREVRAMLDQCFLKDLANVVWEYL